MSLLILRFEYFILRVHLCDFCFNETDPCYEFIYE